MPTMLRETDAVVIGVGWTGAILAEVVKSMAGLTGSAGFVTAASLSWSAFTTAFGVVFAVSAYHDLRVAKEGVDIRQLATVFE